MPAHFTISSLLRLRDLKEFPERYTLNDDSFEFHVLETVLRHHLQCELSEEELAIRCLTSSHHTKYRLIQSILPADGWLPVLDLSQGL